MKRISLSLFICVLLLVANQAGRAGSATWSTTPITGGWNEADNWVPNTIPNSVDDVATFGPSTITGILVIDTDIGAMISYALQGTSFILLRLKMPDIERPYKSPFGMAGAAVTIGIALWTLYYQLQDAAYLKGVYGALAWYVAGLAYFGAIGRHRLILSPEESFALNKGQSSDA